MYTVFYLGNVYNSFVLNSLKIDQKEKVERQEQKEKLHELEEKKKMKMEKIQVKKQTEMEQEMAAQVMNIN